MTMLYYLKSIFIVKADEEIINVYPCAIHFIFAECMLEKAHTKYVLLFTAVAFAADEFIFVVF